MLIYVKQKIKQQQYSDTSPLTLSKQLWPQVLLGMTLAKIHLPFGSYSNFSWPSNDLKFRSGWAELVYNYLEVSPWSIGLLSFLWLANYRTPTGFLTGLLEVLFLISACDSVLSGKRFRLSIASCCSPLSLCPDKTPSPGHTQKEHSSERAAATTGFDCRACGNEYLVSSSPAVGDSGQTVERWSCFIRSQDFASLGLKVVQVLVGKHPVGCHGPFREEWIPSGPSTIQD